MYAPKLLLHTCCAPCLIAPYKLLQETGMQITGFWYNLNIHPYTEYKQRLDAVRQFSIKKELPFIFNDQYGIDEFIIGIDGDIAGRCKYCYTHRLIELARLAKEMSYDFFSTTLLYSKYQNHDLIKNICQEAALMYDVKFYYHDFRELWSDGIKLSKEDGMYRQKYCGCIFSERDRYLGKPIGNKNE